jgi:heme A synthase
MATIPVPAQSVVVLGAQLATGFTPYQAHVLLFCLAMWLGGGMLYIWIISLIFYRYTFFSLSPSDLAPHFGSIWARSRFRPWPERC